MEHLTSGWRLASKASGGVDGNRSTALTPAPGLTLFETIDQSDLPDDETLVIERRPLVFALLNIYPYTSGHVMVLPRRAVPKITELTEDEHDALWDLVRVAAKACEQAFAPDGLNVGVNQGTAGGASQPEHLHVHVVPRWSADTNFMTATADIRVLPMTLLDAWERIRDVWPALDQAESDAV